MGYRRSMYPVTFDAKLSRDTEKGRLLAIFEACHAEQLAAAARSSHPTHGMMYLRLANALENLRHTGDKIKLAVRARRNKTRDRAN